jgi:hypothetical protein
MDYLPQGKNMKSSYENFYAVCPWCNQENIFNRASDLGDLAPIDYRQVNCLFPECSRPFFLNGDLNSPAYAMLINDCYDLMERKHYAHCVLNMAQAYEAFFSQYLRVELLYRPFAVELDAWEADIDRLNRLRKLLYERVAKLTFVPLRNLFMSMVLSGARPASLSESENRIKNFATSPLEPTEDSIWKSAASSDARLARLLSGLLSCKTPKLRNDVVHKLAYRPSSQEVKDCLGETRELLFGLAGRLRVYDDHIQTYRSR